MTLPHLVLVLSALLSATVSRAQFSWQTLPNRNLPTNHSRIEDIYFTSARTGFAVTLHNYILKTTDSGSSWQIKNDTTDDCGFRSVEFLDDGNTGIAAGFGQTGKIFRTTDAGETWINISFSISDSATDGPKQICGLSHFENSFYGVGWWGAKRARFYVSHDAGQTWTTRFLDSSLATCLVDVHFISKDTGFVAGGVKDQVPMYSFESVILKTTDGGQSWTKVFSDTVLRGRVWKLQFLSRRLAFGAIEPLFDNDTVVGLRSNDGGNNWVFMPAGRDTARGFVGTQGIGFIDSLHGWIGGYYSGLWETSNGGGSWTKIPVGSNTNRIFRLDSDRLYAGGRGVYLYSHAVPASVSPHPARVLAPHIVSPISPNPFNRTRVPIELELKSETNVVLHILNASGQKMVELEYRRMKPGKYRYEWDAGNAPAGIYHVWLGTDEIPVTECFRLVR
jgi:photosystem II stability/assembly factor-like uncharacterized protein